LIPCEILCSHSDDHEDCLWGEVIMCNLKVLAFGETWCLHLQPCEMGAPAVLMDLASVICGAAWQDRHFEITI